MAVDLNRIRLDEDAPAERAWLGTLQGNILRGHGRDFGLYIFFTFGFDVGKVRGLLRSLTSRFVTSALVQYDDTRRYRDLRVPGGLFGSLLLTAKGYTTLGCDLTGFKEVPEDDVPERKVLSTFVDGMAKTAEDDFGDPAPQFWDAAFQRPIHALLLLADDDEHHLAREARKAIKEIEEHCTLAGVEAGSVLRDKQERGIEHFGFIDGRSQPLFLKHDFDPNSPNVDKHGESIRFWNPEEPLRRVLVPDPLMKNDDRCHGSFLVFRKLEQDVRGFHLGLQDLAARLGLEGDDASRAGALVVGRFKDGTPCTLQKEDGWFPPVSNNFDYETDGRGSRCPLQAHIRKVNPRGQSLPDGGDMEIERQRRITRRGIPYGRRNPAMETSIDALPTSDVGILFMCYQASINRQFAFIQKRWVNDGFFPVGETGVDPLIGRGRDEPIEHGWSDVYNKDAALKSKFERFVHMKGGEYFFAPSLPFLLTL
jgi:Dyp-type peroxidase family